MRSSGLKLKDSVNFYALEPYGFTIYPFILKMASREDERGIHATIDMRSREIFAKTRRIKDLIEAGFTEEMLKKPEKPIAVKKKRAHHSISRKDLPSSPRWDECPKCKKILRRASKHACVCPICGGIYDIVEE